MNYINRGNSYFSNKDYKLAKLDYEKAISLEPSNPTVYDYLGLLELAIQEYDMGITNFNKAIQLAPQSVNFYFDRGIAYLTIKKNEYAMADLNKIIELSTMGELNQKANAEYYIILVCDQVFSEGIDAQYIRVIAALDETIALNPQFAQAYYYRGLFYGMLNQADVAISNIRKFLELSSLPETDAEFYITTTYYDAGVAKIYQHQYDKAILFFDRLITFNPNLTEAYNSRGFAYARLRYYEAAIKDFNKAIELNPLNERAYYNRGMVYETLGQSDLAIGDFYKVLNIRGNNDSDLKEIATSMLRKLGEPP